MADVEGGFTNIAQNPPPHPPATGPQSRSSKYNVNGNHGTSSSLLSSPKKLLLVIGLFLVISIVIVLCIVLPVMLTRKSTSTESSTTLTTTMSVRAKFLTNCQSNKQGQAARIKNANVKVKMPAAPERLGNRVLIKNTYLVEFASDKSARSHFRTVSRSLKVSENIDEVDIRQRRIIESPLFSGISFTVDANHSIKSIESIKDAIAIYPVYNVQLEKPIESDISPKSLYDGTYDTINSYDLTRTYQAHKTLNNFGAGVKVAVIDTGVYYLHPALGGCFGAGCKVAFGYDMIGDYYNTSDPVIAPDADPLDDCSEGSHGTHVAGIIAANSSGITAKLFASYVPFIGVAPQVTLGAYRVFSCSGETGTDVITAAIYRAYNDNADIINLSLGGPGPYADSSDSAAVQRVTDAGVYVIVSAGNSGAGGLQTTGDPSNAAGSMAIASIDTQSRPLMNYFYIIAPDGTKISYLKGALYGGWKSTVDLRIVVNNPSPVFNDGCFGPSKPILGAVVLYLFNNSDTCTSTERCDLAALQGAAGCLLYNVDRIQGATTIPSGSITLADGLSIVTTVTRNPSAIYSFTDTIVSVSVPTGGTPSYFSSFGLTGDLFLKPQLGGIGGSVYSTVAPHAASAKNLESAYDLMSGTSMAAPYVSGVMALFLASLGNPSPNTARDGYASNGICRPAFSTATSIFQSTAQPVNMSYPLLLATAAQQGAGLVDTYLALTSTTILSPSELSLNDTVRKASSYQFNVTNIGNGAATYRVSHQGAALATGKTSNDDQLLTTPYYSPDYANVLITPTEFALDSGATRQVTLQFTPPPGANTNLVPIYSGFIYVTNQITGEAVHLTYAGVAGDYSSARIIVQNSATSSVTGVFNSLGDSVISDDGLTLNASEILSVAGVLAWSTRVFIVEVIDANDISLTLAGSGRVLYDEYGLCYVANMPRNTAIPTQTFPVTYSRRWDGAFCARLNGTSCSIDDVVSLDPGRYQLRFSALKHFGNASNPNDYEVYRTPIFNLVY